MDQMKNLKQDYSNNQTNRNNSLAQLFQIPRNSHLPNPLKCNSSSNNSNLNKFLMLTHWVQKNFKI